MEKDIKKWLKTLKENEALISMVLGGLVVIVVGILLFNYYRQGQRTAQISELSDATASAEFEVKTKTDSVTGEVTPTNLPATHVVAKGEYLWTIAEKYYGSGFNWVDIAEINKLTNADVVTEGMTLTLPKVRVRTPIALAGATSTPKITTTSPNSYTVKANDTLWSIAEANYKDGYKWVDIYNANKTIIADPGIIEIGWKLTIPKIF